MPSVQTTELGPSLLTESGAYGNANASVKNQSQGPNTKSKSKRKSSKKRAKSKSVNEAPSTSQPRRSTRLRDLYPDGLPSRIPEFIPSQAAQPTAPVPSGSISLPSFGGFTTNRPDILSMPFTPINQEARLESPVEFTPLSPGNTPAPEPPPGVKVQPPEAPIASKQYLDQASGEPTTLERPRRLLVILDLNGTLIYRKRSKSLFEFVPRPGVRTLLKELFENHKVMVWSSARPGTVRKIVEKLFNFPDRQRLVAVWGRDTLGLTAEQYAEKVQVYKPLETVWANKGIQASYPRRKAEKYAEGEFKWDQTNTVLIDDSWLKGIAQPHNIIEIPEFNNDPRIDEQQNIEILIEKLRILSRQRDVSQKLRAWSEGKSAVLSKHNIAPENLDSSTEIDVFWRSQVVSEKEALTTTNKDSKDPRQGALKEKDDGKLVQKVGKKEARELRRQRAKEKKDRKAAEQAVAKAAKDRQGSLKAAREASRLDSSSASEDNDSGGCLIDGKVDAR